MRNNRRRREFDDDEEDGSFATDVPGRRPGVPFDDGDPLWTIYSINPGLPFRVKVEKLMVMWDLGVEEIADALKESEDRVQTEYDRIQSEWMTLGETLSDDELQKARGKMIKELLQHKAELEGLGPTLDQTIIKLKITLTEKIAKLRGLERERKAAEDAEPDGSVASALSHLTPERSRELLERLGRE
jgi:hypothetical protein